MKNQNLDNANTLALKMTDLHKQFGTELVLKGVHLEAAVGDVISMLDSSPRCCSTWCWCFSSVVAFGSGRNTGWVTCVLEKNKLKHRAGFD